MTASVAPADPDDGDEVVVERVPCRCGRLAALVIDDDDVGVVTAAIRCSCGSYAVPGTGERA